MFRMFETPMLSGQTGGDDGTDRTFGEAKVRRHLPTDCSRPTSEVRANTRQTGQTVKVSMFLKCTRVRGLQFY